MSIGTASMSGPHSPVHSSFLHGLVLAEAAPTSLLPPDPRIPPPLPLPAPMLYPATASVTHPDQTMSTSSSREASFHPTMNAATASVRTMGAPVHPTAGTAINTRAVGTAPGDMNDQAIPMRRSADPAAGIVRRRYPSPEAGSYAAPMHASQSSQPPRYPSPTAGSYAAHPRALEPLQPLRQSSPTGSYSAHPRASQPSQPLRQPSPSSSYSATPRAAQLAQPLRHPSPTGGYSADPHALHPSHPPRHPPSPATNYAGTQPLQPPRYPSPTSSNYSRPAAQPPTMRQVPHRHPSPTAGNSYMPTPQHQPHLRAQQIRQLEVQQRLAGTSFTQHVDAQHRFDSTGFVQPRPGTVSPGPYRNAMPAQTGPGRPSDFSPERPNSAGQSSHTQALNAHTSTDDQGPQGHFQQQLQQQQQTPMQIDRQYLPQMRQQHQKLLYPPPQHQQQFEGAQQLGPQEWGGQHLQPDWPDEQQRHDLEMELEDWDWEQEQQQLRQLGHHHAHPQHQQVPSRPALVFVEHPIRQNEAADLLHRGGSPGRVRLFGQPKPVPKPSVWDAPARASAARRSGSPNSRSSMASTNVWRQAAELRQPGRVHASRGIGSDPAAGGDSNSRHAAGSTAPPSPSTNATSSIHPAWASVARADPPHTQASVPSPSAAVPVASATTYPAAAAYPAFGRQGSGKSSRSQGQSEKGLAGNAGELEGVEAEEFTDGGASRSMDMFCSPEAYRQFSKAPAPPAPSVSQEPAQLQGPVIANATGLRRYHSPDMPSSLDQRGLSSRAPHAPPAAPVVPTTLPHQRSTAHQANAGSKDVGYSSSRPVPGSEQAGASSTSEATSNARDSRPAGNAGSTSDSNTAADAHPNDGVFEFHPPSPRTHNPDSAATGQMGGKHIGDGQPSSTAAAPPPAGVRTKAPRPQSAGAQAQPNQGAAVSMYGAARPQSAAPSTTTGAPPASSSATRSKLGPAPASHASSVAPTGDAQPPFNTASSSPSSPLLPRSPNRAASKIQPLQLSFLQAGAAHKGQSAGQGHGHHGSFPQGHHHHHHHRQQQPVHGGSDLHGGAQQEQGLLPHHMRSVSPLRGGGRLNLTAVGATGYRGSAVGLSKEKHESGAGEGGGDAIEEMLLLGMDAGYVNQGEDLRGARMSSTSGHTGVGHIDTHGHKPQTGFMKARGQVLNTSPRYGTAAMSGGSGEDKAGAGVDLYSMAEVWQEEEQLKEMEQLQDQLFSSRPRDSQVAPQLATQHPTSKPVPEGVAGMMAGDLIQHQLHLEQLELEQQEMELIQGLLGGDSQHGGARDQHLSKRRTPARKSLDLSLVQGGGLWEGAGGPVFTGGGNPHPIKLLSAGTDAKGDHSRSGNPRSKHDSRGPARELVGGKGGTQVGKGPVRRSKSSSGLKPAEAGLWEEDARAHKDKGPSAAAWGAAIASGGSAWNKTLLEAMRGLGLNTAGSLEASLKELSDSGKLGTGLKELSDSGKLVEELKLLSLSGTLPAAEGMVFAPNEGASTRGLTLDEHLAALGAEEADLLAQIEVLFARQRGANAKGGLLQQGEGKGGVSAPLDGLREMAQEGASFDHEHYQQQQRQQTLHEPQDGQQQHWNWLQEVVENAEWQELVQQQEHEEGGFGHHQQHQMHGQQGERDLGGLDHQQQMHVQQWKRGQSGFDNQQQIHGQQGKRGLGGLDHQQQMEKLQGEHDEGGLDHQQQMEKLQGEDDGGGLDHQQQQQQQQQQQRAAHPSGAMPHYASGSESEPTGKRGTKGADDGLVPKQGSGLALQGLEGAWLESLGELKSKEREELCVLAQNRSPAELQALIGYANNFIDANSQSYPTFAQVRPQMMKGLVKLLLQQMAAGFKGYEVAAAEECGSGKAGQGKTHAVAGDHPALGLKAAPSAGTQRGVQARAAAAAAVAAAEKRAAIASREHQHGRALTVALEETPTAAALGRNAQTHANAGPGREDAPADKASTRGAVASANEWAELSSCTSAPPNGEHEPPASVPALGINSTVKASDDIGGAGLRADTSNEGSVPLSCLSGNVLAQVSPNAPARHPPRSSQALVSPSALVGHASADSLTQNSPFSTAQDSPSSPPRTLPTSRPSLSQKLARMLSRNSAQLEENEHDDEHSARGGSLASMTEGRSSSSTRLILSGLLDVGGGKEQEQLQGLHVGKVDTQEDGQSLYVGKGSAHREGQSQLLLQQQQQLDSGSGGASELHVPPQEQHWELELQHQKRRLQQQKEELLQPSPPPACSPSHRDQTQAHLGHPTPHISNQAHATFPSKLDSTTPAQVEPSTDLIIQPHSLPPNPSHPHTHSSSKPNPPPFYTHNLPQPSAPPLHTHIIPTQHYTPYTTQPSASAPSHTAQESPLNMPPQPPCTNQHSSEEPLGSPTRIEQDPLSSTINLSSSPFQQIGQGAASAAVQQTKPGAAAHCEGAAGRKEAPVGPWQERELGGANSSASVEGSAARVPPPQQSKSRFKRRSSNNGGLRPSIDASIRAAPGIHSTDNNRDFDSHDGDASISTAPDATTNASTSKDNTTFATLHTPQPAGSLPRTVSLQSEAHPPHTARLESAHSLQGALELHVTQPSHPPQAQTAVTNALQPPRSQPPPLQSSQPPPSQPPLPQSSPPPPSQPPLPQSSPPPPSQPPLPQSSQPPLSQPPLPQSSQAPRSQPPLPQSSPPALPIASKPGPQAPLPAAPYEVLDDGNASEAQSKRAGPREGQGASKSSSTRSSHDLVDPMRPKGDHTQGGTRKQKSKPWGFLTGLTSGHKKHKAEDAGAQEEGKKKGKGASGPQVPKLGQEPTLMPQVSAEAQAAPTTAPQQQQQEPQVGPPASPRKKSKAAFLFSFTSRKSKDAGPTHNTTSNPSNTHPGTPQTIPTPAQTHPDVAGKPSSRHTSPAHKPNSAHSSSAPRSSSPAPASSPNPPPADLSGVPGDVASIAYPTSDPATWEGWSGTAGGWGALLAPIQDGAKPPLQQQQQQQQQHLKQEIGRREEEQRKMQQEKEEKARKEEQQEQARREEQQKQQQQQLQQQREKAQQEGQQQQLLQEAKERERQELQQRQAREKEELECRRRKEKQQREMQAEQQRLLEEKHMLLRMQQEEQERRESQHQEQRRQQQQQKQQHDPEQQRPRTASPQPANQTARSSGAVAKELRIIEPVLSEIRSLKASITPTTIAAFSAALSTGLPPPPFTNKDGSPYNPQIGSPEGPQGPPQQHPELHPAKLRRLAGLLSELAEFSKGLEQRHGTDHSVAIKLRVLHRDLSKWAQPVLYPLGLVPLTEGMPSSIRSNAAGSAFQASGHKYSSPRCSQDKGPGGLGAPSNMQHQQQLSSGRSSQDSPGSSVSLASGRAGSGGPMMGALSSHSHSDSPDFSFPTSRPTMPSSPNHLPPDLPHQQHHQHHRQQERSAPQHYTQQQQQEQSPTHPHPHWRDSDRSPSSGSGSPLRMGEGLGLMGGFTVGGGIDSAGSMERGGAIPLMQGSTDQMSGMSGMGSSSMRSSRDQMAGGMTQLSGMSGMSGMGSSSMLRSQMSSGMNLMSGMSGMEGMGGSLTGSMGGSLHGSKQGGGQLQDMAALMAQQAATMQSMTISSSAPASPHAAAYLGMSPFSPMSPSQQNSLAPQQVLHTPAHNLPQVQSQPPNHHPDGGRSAAAPAEPESPQKQPGGGGRGGSPGRGGMLKGLMSFGKGKGSMQHGSPGATSAVEGSADSNAGSGSSKRPSGSLKQAAAPTPSVPSGVEPHKSSSRPGSPGPGGKPVQQTPSDKSKTKGGASAMASLFFG